MALTDLWTSSSEEVSELRSLHDSLDRMSTEQAAAIDRATYAIRSSTADAISAYRQSANEVVDTLSWGFSSLETELQQHSRELGRMAETLETPESTRAAEKAASGRRAYENGARTNDERWFREAVEDLHAAVEIDRYSYGNYSLLGEIYAFRLSDDDQARWAYLQAAHYAWPCAPKTSAFSLLGLALVVYANDGAAKAFDYAIEATRRAPDSGETWFQAARYYRMSYRGPHEALFDQASRDYVADLVTRAVRAEAKMFVRIAGDPVLADVREVDDALRELFDTALAARLADVQSTSNQLDNGELAIARLKRQTRKMAARRIPTFRGLLASIVEQTNLARPLLPPLDEEVRSMAYEDLVGDAGGRASLKLSELRNEVFTRLTAVSVDLATYARELGNRQSKRGWLAWLVLPALAAATLFAVAREAGTDASEIALNPAVVTTVAIGLVLWGAAVSWWNTVRLSRLKRDFEAAAELFEHRLLAGS